MLYRQGKYMELEPSVIQSIKEGKKVSAIKELRRLRGIGLKEAKELVDQYQIDNNIQPSSDQKSSGGQPALVIIVILALIFVAYSVLEKA